MAYRDIVNIYQDSSADGSPVPDYTGTPLYANVPCRITTRFHGSPPHLQNHSSGVLVLTYGYRQAPFGQRAALSQDDGETWEHDWIIRDDGLDFDLGYPSSVELADGSLFSVYY